MKDTQLVRVPVCVLRDPVLGSSCRVYVRWMSLLFYQLLFRDIHIVLRRATVCQVGVCVPALLHTFLSVYIMQILFAWHLALSVCFRLKSIYAAYHQTYMLKFFYCACFSFNKALPINYVIYILPSRRNIIRPVTLNMLIDISFTRKAQLLPCLCFQPAFRQAQTPPSYSCGVPR